MLSYTVIRTHAQTHLLGTGEKFEDGSHILYVNGAYRGDTSIGKLMHDFSCTDAEDMYYGTLAERVKFSKRARRGLRLCVGLWRI